MLWTVDSYESQKGIHFTGHPLNWGREILGSFTLALGIGPGLTADGGRSTAGGGGLVARESSSAAGLRVAGGRVPAAALVGEVLRQ